MKETKVLITGTSQGIGKAIAELFLCMNTLQGNKTNALDDTPFFRNSENHFTVYGIDRQNPSINNPDYIHYICDIRNYDKLPQIEGINILINNAGTQNENDIDTNLKALIHITEKYGIQSKIKSILNIGSASGHTGAEFPEYCASKGGVLAYTKNVAMRIAPYGATCNSLDPGGVLTPLNQCVIEDASLWEQIMKETPLKKWATPEEIAQWAYFLTVINTFCTGQNILVDGGEATNFNFVWKD